jgi:hypothetical protein
VASSLTEGKGERDKEHEKENEQAEVKAQMQRGRWKQTDRMSDTRKQERDR